MAATGFAHIVKFAGNERIEAGVKKTQSETRNTSGGGIQQIFTLSGNPDRGAETPILILDYWAIYERG